MTVYRDCSTTDGAQFDNMAAMTIYRENLDGSYTYNSQLDFEIPINGDVESVPPPDNPCLIAPPGICVEKATYILTAPLPTISTSYHVVYQRCCRNETITNIVNPGEVGATYTMELTSKAQQICNDSPVFDDFPPILICANEPLVFDHSATDADGDQLVYEFCSPIDGGGLGGLGLPGNPSPANSCTGVQPNPACPPPFNPVVFILPTYTALNPMGGNPQISINPTTGVITGTPNIQGQYVVGVCVKEYRNGDLISLTKRDFQFNVTNCTATVDAMIDYDELIGQDQYVINACGINDVTFTNLSVQQQYITEYGWTFDIAGNIESFGEWEPTVTFPGIGSYEGQLILNPNTDCGDTANIFVNVYPAIEADFSFEYDTCVAGPVDFTDLSFSEAGPGTITDWNWVFSNQGNSTEQDPSFQFMDPGNLPVSLTVTDINNCTDTETQIIEWYPAPAIILIEPSIFDGCSPQEVFFNNLSFPVDSTYDIVWDFGDGTIGSDISPTHIYEEPGIYNISLEITSPLGCFISESWNNWIIVRPSPIADFIFSPLELSSFDPTANFTNQSIDAVSWEWDFDGDGSSIQLHPSFTFPDTGKQEITLVVTHESGCKDTLTKIIDVVPKVTYFLPNAFTPNSDNVNDFFRGNGIFEGMLNFKLSIWNRWGEMVFETNDPTYGWNGQKNNNGDLSPNGVYVCIVTYTGPRGGDFEIKGFATLIK